SAVSGSKGYRLGASPGSAPVPQEPGQVRLFRCRIVSTRPAVQHIGQPRNATSAPVAGIRVHQPKDDPYPSTTAKDPNPTAPRTIWPLIVWLLNISSTFYPDR